MISADGLTTILPQRQGNRIRQGKLCALAPMLGARGDAERGLNLGDVALGDGAVVVELAVPDPGALRASRCPCIRRTPC